MKRLEAWINLFLVLAVLAAIGAGVWVWREQHHLYARIKAEVEIAATGAIGLPVEVGAIEGLWWRSLEIKDIRIRGGAAKGAPVVLRVPRVRARFSVPEILRLGKQPVEVEVVGPVVSLSRDEAGKFNIRPRARPAAPPAELPRLPRIHLVVRDGTIDWLDRQQATSSQTVPFQRRIALERADLTLERGKLAWSADLRDAAAQVQARGRHDLDRGKGELSLDAAGIDLPDWFSYAAANDDFRIVAGLADVKGAASYDLDRPDRLEIAGRARIAGVEMSHKDVLAPVKLALAEVSFDREAVRIEKLAGTLAGTAIDGAGAIAIGDPRKPTIDLRLTAPAVNLADMATLVPEVIPFDVSGSGRAVVRVHGSAVDPEIDLDATIDRAVALRERLGPGTAHVHVHRFKADVTDIALAVHGGRATGEFWFTMDLAPRAGGRFAFDGVEIGPAAAPYLPRPLPLHGRASGVVELAGPLDAIRISGEARIHGGGIGAQPIESGFARFQVQRGNTHVSDILLVAPDGGRLGGDIGWDDGGDLVMDLAATDVDLRALRRAGLDVDVTGRATATLACAGNMLAADSLELSGLVRAVDGQAYGQPISDVAGEYRLAGGRLDLTGITGHTAGARVAGWGFVAPLSFERALPPPDVRFEFDAVDADLAEIPALQRAVVGSLGGLTGRASARNVRLRFADGVLAVAGTGEAGELDAPRVGRASRLSGEFDLDWPRLRLQDVSVSQASATVDVSGEVVFRESPELALLLRTRGGDARALLSAIHWRGLLQSTGMARRVGEPEPGATTRPFVALPDREVFRADPSSPLDFASIYKHWQSASREPQFSDKGQVQAARPFWEAIDGTVDAEVRIDGLARDPYLFAEVDVSGASAYGHALRKASMLAWYGRGELAVDHLDLQAVEGGEVHSEGSLGRGRSLEVAATGLDLAWLNPWLQGKDLSLSGRASARVVASGELSGPRFDITASAQRGHISDFVYDRASAAAVLEGGRLAVSECALEKDGKEARIAGTLPVGKSPEDTTLDLTLDVGGQGLGVVSVLSKGLIDWRGGGGTLHVDILGTQADPRLRGVLRLQGARIAVRTLEGEITDIDAEAQIGAGVVKVGRMTARHGGGRLEGQGYITMRQFKFESYLLDVWADGVKVRLTNGLFAGQVDGHMGVRGRFERPSVTGELAVSSGKLTLNSAQAGTEDGGGGPPVDLTGLTLDIKDTVSVLQQNLMDVRVRGTLLVSGTVVRPDFKGVVNVVPGGTITTFYTNTFKVEDGSTVEFIGSGRPTEEGDLFAEILGEDRQRQAIATAVPNARVRVVASTTVVDSENLHPDPSEIREAEAGGSLATHKPKTVAVKATITGSLTDLKFAFASDPPSYTQAEIETLLGKPGAITGFFSALAPRATGSADTGAMFRTVSRDVGYGAATWFANQFIRSTLDPLLGTVLSDYGLDLIGDPTRPELLTGFNLGLSARTRSVGPFSASYRRVINTGASGQGSTKRYGLNLADIPLNIPLAGRAIDWLSPTAALQSFGISLVLEDTSGSGGEYPTGGLDLSGTGALDALPLYDLTRKPVRPYAWQGSIQIGIRGRL